MDLGGLVQGYLELCVFLRGCLFVFAMGDFGVIIFVVVAIVVIVHVVVFFCCWVIDVDVVVVVAVFGLGTPSQISVPFYLKCFSGSGKWWGCVAFF